jgi:hypothetical protein
MYHYNHPCYPGPDNSRLIFRLNVTNPTHNPHSRQISAHNSQSALTILNHRSQFSIVKISVLPIVKISVLPIVKISVLSIMKIIILPIVKISVLIIVLPIVTISVLAIVPISTLYNASLSCQVSIRVNSLNLSTTKSKKSCPKEIIL